MRSRGRRLLHFALPAPGRWSRVLLDLVSPPFGGKLGSPDRKVLLLQLTAVVIATVADGLLCVWVARAIFGRPPIWLLGLLEADGLVYAFAAVGYLLGAARYRRQIGRAHV